MNKVMNVLQCAHYSNYRTIFHFSLLFTPLFSLVIYLFKYYCSKIVDSKCMHVRVSLSIIIQKHI